MTEELQLEGADVQDEEMFEKKIKQKERVVGNVKFVGNLGGLVVTIRTNGF